MKLLYHTLIDIIAKVIFIHPKNKTMHPNNFQGHRGARGLLPENSIPAFLHCLSLGINTLELDVVISQDKQVIISHESWFNHEITSLPNGQSLAEAVEKKELLYQLPYKKIKTFDCGLRGHPKFPMQQPMAVAKPRLVDMVKACETYTNQHQLKPVNYTIEIKCFEQGDGTFHPAPSTYVQLVYQTIIALGIEKQVVIQSFDKRILRAMKAIAPHLPLSLLIEDVLTFEHHITDLGFTPNIYAPYYKLITNNLVKKVKTKNMKLFAWTVNDKAIMQQLLAKGVDSIITDYPNLAVELLEGND